MRVAEIRERAKAVGMEGVARMRKGELIRAIQRNEGNFECFGSEGRFDCPEEGCCWRSDCLTSNPH